AASRGCYWRRCECCPEALAPVHPYAALAAAKVPLLMRELAECFGADQIHFTDDALPPAVLQALAAQPGGPRWHGFARFEGMLADPAFTRRLAASGCRLLQLGLESGSQAVLDRLRKGTQVAEAAAVLDALRQAGIATYVYVLLGTPGETLADAEATLSFLEQQADKIDFLNLAIMNLPRPAGETELPAEEGLGFYREFAPSPGWDRRAVRRFLKERLLGSPAVRAAVNRVPPAFTSNHAYLFSPARGRG
ncbi:MAG: radical SAM protein, partial [Desulfuromonadales bacterium]|nr:radical SAM protein [Desulfuromonadales bacterium]